MQPEPFRPLFRFSGASRVGTGPARVELLLRTADGRVWVLDMEAGCERFIGLYPRICGIEDERPLLEYRTAGAL
jgi:hypothetical protein